ncbi:family 43 glycosylhydrolase [Sphingomonas sp. AR_OL41]|uniref:family 43 glycosylhydrolase n=1 Tax=Sphingomonas sp. AR_OL41 TaxID=3042729 RepID=UPI002480A16D|nr:family 43 glycosylhydrolase [Sphingomonas sp. AR_OL41]MDH7971940.1 family 43 glycosylhydrolase [Sphingomonas sp. AR_OL41]
MRKTTLLAAAAALLLPVAALPQEVKSVIAGADPAAAYFDGQLWVDPTGRGDRLEAWSSPDRISFTRAGQLLALKDIGWVKDDKQPRHYLWAPDMVAAAGKYYLYYSVGPQNPTPSRLGVAVCETPKGPCVDSGKPLLTGGNGFEAIDPMVFVDRKSGTRYLYAGGSAGAKLRVFTLKPDMVTIDQEVKIEQPPLFTEGVFMHERGGIYYLSYSHGPWNTAGYAVHYAMAPSPLGPWKYRGVLLQSDKKYKGPGHHSFVQDPKDGSWWIVYHRWEGKKGDGPYEDDRRVAIQPISYDQYGQIVPIKMTP